MGRNGNPKEMDAIVVLEDRSMSIYNYRTSAEVVERGRYHDDLVPQSDQLTRQAKAPVRTRAGVGDGILMDDNDFHRHLGCITFLTLRIALRCAPPILPR